jgi:acyl-coenzyme A thioesterase PaaI-like protein
MLRDILHRLAPPDPRGAADFIRSGWDRCRKVPGGQWLFSRWLGRVVPYTGTIQAQVIALESGHARVRMKDRPGLRNHLGSVHAIALCNLAEFTGNLALGYSLPPNSRFIVSELSMRYLKKARGTIEARCDCTAPSSNARQNYLIEVQLFDATGLLVAESSLQTLVSPAL